MVTVEGSESTGVPVGGVPVAVAMFVMEPASTSACVTVYVAVQVICIVGMSNAAPAGQVTGDMVPIPVNEFSLTATLLRVTLPVLVTTNEYVISRPTVNEAASEGDADFTSVNAGAGAAVTVAVDGPESVGVVAPGAVPCATAVFVTEPASISACVTV
jgi:hypothetical protein